MWSAFQTDGLRSSARRTQSNTFHRPLFVALSALTGPNGTSRRESAGTQHRSSIDERSPAEALDGFDLGVEPVNALIVGKTIAEIRLHAREDWASTRLDAGIMSPSAR